jgi:hypothetical protein
MLNMTLHFKFMYIQKICENDSLNSPSICVFTFKSYNNLEPNLL